MNFSSHLKRASCELASRERFSHLLWEDDDKKAGVGISRRRSPHGKFIIPNAGVIARPPIGAAGGVGLLAEPVAIAAIGVVVIVVVGTVNPHPRTVAEDPMTIVVVVVVVVVVVAATLCIATVIAMVAVRVAATIAAIVTAGAGGRAIEIAAGVSALPAIVAAAATIGEIATTARAVADARTAAATASNGGTAASTTAAAVVTAVATAAATAAAAAAAIAPLWPPPPPPL